MKYVYARVGSGCQIVYPAQTHTCHYQVSWLFRADTSSYLHCLWWNMTELRYSSFVVVDLFFTYHSINIRKAFRIVPHTVHRNVMEHYPPIVSYGKTHVCVIVNCVVQCTRCTSTFRTHVNPCIQSAIASQHFTISIGLSDPQPQLRYALVCACVNMCTWQLLIEYMNDGAYVWSIQYPHQTTWSN